MTKRLVAMLAVLAGLAMPTLATADLAPELQVELQSAMLAHLDEIAPDGAYTYLDTDLGALRTVYPANVHPFVVEAGGDYFVCSEMIDEDGNNLTADFLVRRVGDVYRVVQVLIDDRAALQALMAQAGR